MTVELVIALAVVVALAYFLVFKKKGDVNQDGKVDATDVKVVAEKVEAKVEEVAVEAQAVAEVAVAKVKKTATKAKAAAKGTAGKAGSAKTTAQK